MREIKFRAWNYESELMLTWDEIKEPIIINGEVANTLADILTGELPMIPLQYTGLKDKNGVEIYECDIVWDAHTEEHGEVIFKSGEYLCEWETHSDSLSNELDDIEIAGNIYEHPELLERE